MSLHIKVWCEYCADRSRDGVVITQAASLSIHRTRVHTTATLDTLEGITEVNASKLPASACVDEHQMHFLPRPWFSVVTRIDRNRCANGAAGEHAQENTQVLFFWNEFLETHGRDVYVRQVGAHVCVALVSAYDKLTGFRYSEVYASQGTTACKEYVAQMFSSRPRQECGIG